MNLNAIATMDLTSQKKKEEEEKLSEKRKAAESTKTGKRKCGGDMDDESEEEHDSPSNLPLDLNSVSNVETMQKRKKGGKTEKIARGSVQV